MSEKAAELAERLRQRWAGPMTDAEGAFLQDVQGFIEFAIRNGLTFPMVMSCLTHDVNELARDGFRLDATRSRGYLPQVSGYAKLGADDFGASEEDQPA